jgi:hypothetical protein
VTVTVTGDGSRGKLGCKANGNAEVRPVGPMRFFTLQMQLHRSTITIRYPLQLDHSHQPRWSNISRLKHRSQFLRRDKRCFLATVVNSQGARRPPSLLCRASMFLSCLNRLGTFTVGHVFASLHHHGKSSAPLLPPFSIANILLLLLANFDPAATPGRLQTTKEPGPHH